MPNRTLDEEPTSAKKELAIRVLTGSLLSLLILFTLLGNALVCAAVVRFRHLRTKVTNIFIVSLAVSDLLVAVLVMPWKAVAEVAGYWPFGPFCNVWVAFDIMCSTASILNLCVISVDRYWAISSPFRYERKMSRRLALLVIGLTWAFSLLISFIPVQLNWHSSQPREGAPANSSAATLPDNCDSSLNRTYAISSSLVSFYIPVAIMLVTYTRIYRIAQIQIRRIASLERAAEHAQSCQRSKLDSQQQHIQHHSILKSSFKKETKVLKTLSIIMGVFVCCWLPFFILNCLVPFCDRSSPASASSLSCVSESTFDIFVWFGWANSTLNPVVYAFNAEFRKAFSSLLGCHIWCSSNQVETVNISNELVSYNQDTAFHKEIVTAYVNMIPNVVDSVDQVFDRVSQISAANELATYSVSEMDCDADLSLDKITPFTPNGLH
ncbi:D(1B) dopamine receptor [Heterodontus francisci]|uniref:D(1B) dopamine receptor n=1 Tax=Heterodontus francisci TaxID=7792 RepID=UPI00355AD195